MESMTLFITEQLTLKVNEAKSSVARPQQRKSGFPLKANGEAARRP